MDSRQLSHSGLLHRLSLSGPVVWLIAINASVFLIVWAIIILGNSFGLKGNFTMPWLGVSDNLSVILHRPWTLLTYMVTQYDFLHLLFNLLWLYCFGMLLSYSGHSLHIIILYIGGGITGAIVYAAVANIWPDQTGLSSYLCGSSAAILSVMAGTALMMPEHKITLFLLGPVKLKWLALICLLLTFAGQANGNHASLGAHIGGAVFGLLFSISLRVSCKGNHAHDAAKNKIKIRKILNVNRNGQAVVDAITNRPDDNVRLDQLLDKIRLSGYPSLTNAERNELNLLSRKLGREKN